MVVRASDGSRLGVVTACGNVQFYLRKGLLNPEKYVALYSEIADLPKGDVLLRRGTDGLIEPAKAPPAEGPLTHTKPIHSLPRPPSAQS